MERRTRCELLTMVGAGGTRTYVHPHVSHPLYHCATDAETYVNVICLLFKDIENMKDNFHSNSFLVGQCSNMSLRNYFPFISLLSFGIG